ncbi:hypothetical protein B0A50_02560 [Salinomyces thailandicus]|uniref:Uncharacterized protein n=1 Tax=Salinomyces thailandicus TaxID=706561 RepID=A0A4U0U5C9_9PEZI|nr:hypothetical protein B0A50_02560 [Salinomyces thailandica]
MGTGSARFVPSSTTDVTGSSIVTAPDTGRTTAVATWVTMTMSTVTVIGPTILRTTFVTIQRSTEPVQPTSTVPTSALSSSSSILATHSPSTSPDTLAILPKVITQGSESRPWSTATTSSTRSTSETSSASSNVAAPSSGSLQKHAIIGGLSGAIAGLVLIGVIICFCLRRRRKATETPDPTHEKGMIRPAIKRKWTELTGRGTPNHTPQITQSTPVIVDEDHHIIRMSTQHWARPYAEGQGEGYREFAGPAPLRVVNPDLSRPNTPSASSLTAGSFLKRQRSALAVVLLSAGRSRSGSKASAYQTKDVPDITIDPILSQECVANIAETPSFRSYPSLATLPEITQHPPEDPFITPPLETGPRQRPGLTPLQTASTAAKRTLSHLSSFLNPFSHAPPHSSLSPSSSAADNPATRNSATTLSSAFSSRLSHRNTAYSDPFDLDKPSVRGSGPQPTGAAGDSVVGEVERLGIPPIWAMEMQRRERERLRHPPMWQVYEGT